MHLQDGDSALMVSAYNGNPDIVERLLKMGAQVNILNKVSIYLIFCRTAVPQIMVTFLSGLLYIGCVAENKPTKFSKGSVHV